MCKFYQTVCACGVPIKSTEEVCIQLEHGVKKLFSLIMAPHVGCGSPHTVRSEYAYLHTCQHHETNSCLRHRVNFDSEILKVHCNCGHVIEKETIFESNSDTGGGDYDAAVPENDPDNRQPMQAREKALTDEKVSEKTQGEDTESKNIRIVIDEFNFNAECTELGGKACIRQRARQRRLAGMEDAIDSEF